MGLIWIHKRCVDPYPSHLKSTSRLQVDQQLFRHHTVNEIQIDTVDIMILLIIFWESKASASVDPYQSHLFFIEVHQYFFWAKQKHQETSIYDQQNNKCTPRIVDFLDTLNPMVPISTVVPKLVLTDPLTNCNQFPMSWRSPPVLLLKSILLDVVKWSWNWVYLCICEQWHYLHRNIHGRFHQGDLQEWIQWQRKELISENLSVD